MDARPVPVVVTTVEQRDLPIYLDGLGSVAPLQSVLVKTQVDGRLDQVFFREGQFVKKGERIAQIDPRPFTIELQQAQAALARDEAQLENAKVNLERYKSLVKEAIVPEQQVADQKAQVDQLHGTIAGDQAAVASARLQLDFASIESPLDGVTGVRKVDPGNIVRAADPDGIVVITQLDPIALLFTLPQDDLPRVSAEMAKGTLEVEAHSRDGAVKLGVGKVTLIDNAIDPATATMKLKAELPNPDKHLWPNQFVKARLRLATRQGVLVIPAAAVQRGPRGTFVYGTGPDQSAVVKPIEVQLIQGELAVITGLAVGETVVLEGQGQLRPGSKLAPRSDKREGGGVRGAP
jgi:multidrug efflux system membrane fusion protein